MIATAIHAGHELRPEVRAWLALDDDGRLREEDPGTDRIASRFNTHIVVARSRFEVDLNRRREEAVYRTPSQSWDLQVWRDNLPADVVERSLAIYDAFYGDLGCFLDRASESGSFFILDIHSFNHRRGPDRAAAPQAGNPDVNVGTGSLNERWRPVVDAFIGKLGRREVRGQKLDVRENVRFKGAHLARWVHQRYPDTGCVLALEFKKTFMDEWTGIVDFGHLDELADALRATVPALLPILWSVK